MPARRLLTAVTPLCAVLACAGGDEERTRTPGRESAGAVRVDAAATARCYRSSHSVLLGPSTSSGQNGAAPGWLRLDRLADVDSGSGELVDANHAGLSASWRRGPADSVLVVAADDFLRIEMRLALSERVAAGLALATSDAALERDTSGELRTLRRAWSLHAVAAPCDDMVIRATGR